MSLTVEDGTGLADADSYIEVADVDAFLAAYEPAAAGTTWAALSTAEKERFCRLGTQYVDLTYGLRFLGVRVLATQALLWPREEVYTLDGFLLESDVIPPALKNACCEIAWRASTGDELLASIAEIGVIASESVSVGPVTESKTYLGGKSETARPSYPRVRGWLASLVGSSNQLYAG